MKRALTRIINWGHELLAEVLEPGDLAVDLTAGNGHDTLMLQRLVGDGGRVISFDVQEQALQATERRLRDSGAAVRRLDAATARSAEPGVILVAASHAELDRYVAAEPKGIVANLGFLPGGDRSLITRPETTLTALAKSCELLAPGGRMAVVVYPGHSGGKEEAEQVDAFFRSLPEQTFSVLCLRVSNRCGAPYLQVAEKNCRSEVPQQQSAKSVPE
mgnify:CR=1 FL=1